MTLRPVGSGTAKIVIKGGQQLLTIQARLPQSARNEAYEVWLYNTRRDAISLGAQVPDRRGLFEGARELPRNYQRYRFIDISRERITGPKGHSGRSVLRTRLEAQQ